MRLGLVAGRWSERRVYEVPLESFTRHAAVFGMTGSGKSTLLKVLSYELASLGVSVVVLDRTGEFSWCRWRGVRAEALVPGENLFVDPLTHPGSPDERADSVVSLIAHYLQASGRGALTPLQERVLREALAGLGGDHSLPALAEEARRISGKAKARGWLESGEALASRLAPLLSGVSRRVFASGRETLSPAKLWEPGLHLVDLGALPTDEARDMLSEIVLFRVYHWGKARGPSSAAELVLVVDEAHHLAPAKPGYTSMIERIALELRKYGIGVAVAASRPTLVSENITANAGLLASLRITSLRDAEKIAEHMVPYRAAAEELAAQLFSLPTGHAVARSVPQPDPTRVEIGLEEHRELVACTGSQKPPSPPPREDTAWHAYKAMPEWARQLAAQAARQGGVIAPGQAPRELLERAARSARPILARRGGVYKLTRLGWKIAAIKQSQNS